MTLVALHGERWHLIEDFDHFRRRWQKAYRKRQFFLIRYAGINRWVNPNAIICAQREL